MGEAMEAGKRRRLRLQGWNNLPTPLVALSSLLLLLSGISLGTAYESPHGHLSDSDRYSLEQEYDLLYSSVDDKAGLEAIKALHQQLDDDQDGTIEPSETGDFIKEDLKFDGDGRRERIFHKKDTEITVTDLWHTWVKSEVHNWTAEQTADWLKHSVDLPQYADLFLDRHVNGSKLPLAASDPAYLSKVLGISNTIHRSKITLKAMDVVLFGPPKEPTNWLKDVILSGVLIALVTTIYWANKQKKRSEEHLAKMIKDMESLTKAEQALKELQSKFVVDEGEEPQRNNGNNNVTIGEGEVDRLREEVEILRGELHRAEIELEDRCWVAPTALQHWLQYTYELECRVYNEKRKSADLQMHYAKEACDKLKKKGSSLLGAFVSTHGSSIVDVDKSILEAKTALHELTQDLADQRSRWKQIEMLTGVSIINNPGLHILEKIVRYVGGGNRHIKSGLTSSRLSCMSSEELLQDDDARSVATSSFMSTHTSLNRSLTPALSQAPLFPARVEAPKVGSSRRSELSRESSKESSNSESDEILADIKLRGLKTRASQSSISSDVSRLSQLSVRPSTPPLMTPAPANLTKRGKMVKSLSQDHAAGTQQQQQQKDQPQVALSSSVSDSDINSAAAAAIPGSKSVASHLDEIEESCSASDTGSLSDLDSKKKKRRSFFNFRRKKDKPEASAS